MNASGSIVRVVTATRAEAGERLDLVLCRRLADVRSATRTKVQTWIRNGAVTVNGRRVSRPAARAGYGAEIHVLMPPDEPRLVMAPEPIPLDVVFEDDHLLAVNKPPDMVVHPTYRHGAGTLMNGLLWLARDWSTGQRPSLVGRLDRHTSGVVLVAKTRRVHAGLQRTLAQPASEKAYLALVYGRAVPARGAIDCRLARDASDRRRVVASSAHGVQSLTRFERLARVAAPRAGLGLLRCRLVTGRTHQIRVHLGARGWPIVGDPQYGEPRWTFVRDPRLAATLRDFPRQALHAWSLGFAHPVTGSRLHIVAPVPPDLADLLRSCGFSVP